MRENIVLFCYDGPVFFDEDNHYYGSALNNNVFNRYRFFANKVKVMIRTKKIDRKVAVEKMSKIDENIEIIKIDNLNSIKGIFFKYVKEKKIIEQQVKKSDFVVIRMPSKIGKIALEYCNKYSKKYFVEMVGCIFDSYWNHSLKGKIIAPIAFFKVRRAIRQAKNVIYVTDEFLQKRYPTCGYSISCSDVDIEEANNKILENRIKKIKRNKDKIIIGTCAALNIRYKGQVYVIKALKKLKKLGYNNIEYQLVGGGKVEWLLKKSKRYKVDDCINVIGSLPHEKIFEWLDNIDIYVQPSNQEGLCRALIEAMSRAVPCIASSTGGNPELIDDALIFKRKKVKDLCDKIKVTIENQDLQIKQAVINFETAKIYNKKKLCQKRNNFYNKIKNEKV